MYVQCTYPFLRMENQIVKMMFAIFNIYMLKSRKKMEKISGNIF